MAVAEASIMVSGAAARAPQLQFGLSDTGSLSLVLIGDWTLKSRLPSSDAVARRLETATMPTTLSYDARQLGAWDSGLLAFLTRVQEIAKARKLGLDVARLPEGARRLLKLASSSPERAGARRTGMRAGFLTRVGEQSLALWHSTGGLLEFLGQALLALGNLLIGRAHFRRSDLLGIMFECGAAALPIVSLISFLVGLILAFVGAVQLKQFGAQIYVANLVGIATAREMGALMTAIIMAGRTGAAFAAQLGTMQVNEEIDALATFGLSPLEFLVLPRMIALVLMMPLLCTFADLMGILGGLVVGVTMLGVSPVLYLDQTLNSVALSDLVLGIVKSSVFGILVAIAGCLRGMQSGRSASDVGLAATSAVVTSIVFIIATDGVFAILTQALGV